ncbi:MAG: glucose-6-phosphate isomerase [Methanomicrobiaceae archaeon]|nr:glucose-6-phosphate isomerase [Methanomicrobiaceae archaeon]
MNKFWEDCLPVPATRTIDDMRHVLAIPGAYPNNILYFMYRSLSKNENDREWLSAHLLRFDLTRIPAGTISGEFVKTKGHYHPAAPDGRGYPELYQVISGHAHYLLQKEDLSDIVVVEAGPGDIVLIPPGYGHVSINPSSEELLMSNIVSDAFSSIYGDYEEKQGAAYYEFEGSGWSINPSYADIAEIRFAQPGSLEDLGIPAQKSIYELVGDDEKLAFLNRPSILDDFDIIP